MSTPTNRRFALSTFPVLLFALIATLPTYAQAPCAPRATSLKPTGATIFTPEQEGYLGDVVTDQLSLGNIIYPETDLTEPLDRIAARLLKYLPENQYRFRFSLMAIPDANALAFPGGRVLVSTQLIALASTEDELASVIAHEMGHILARQASVKMTKIFKDILNVTSVNDRQDILDKFNQLLDRANRKPGSVGREEDDQAVADQVSSEATWRAGYDPQAGPRFFDRLSENKGETGGFFSDLFGVTNPESRRYREMVKAANAIPASCKESRLALNDGEFQEWQKKIAALTLNDLISSSTNRTPARLLTPKLRPQIFNLRFSPDGSLILAQDESSIDIVRREPLQHLFRVPALGAGRAIFSKDANRLLFVTAGGRPESWNLQTRARERAWQPSQKHGCGMMAPSPDGRVVACMVGPFATAVRLVDLESDTEIARHNFNKIDAIPVRFAFSADGSVFLGAAFAGEAPWAFDLNKRAAISIPNPLKGALSSAFAFVGADRIATAHPQNPNESGLYSWPDGKVVAKFAIPKAAVEPATSGGAIVIRPVRQYGVQDKAADQLIKQSPDLKRLLDATRNRNELSLLEVLSLETGDVLGRVLINNGGAFIRSINVAGRILFVEDSSNRTLAYSLDTGLRTGQLFGRIVAVDTARGLAAVQNQPGAISVVNGSMRSLASFDFPRNVIYAGFDSAGERLLVLSGAQEVFIENIPE